MIDAASTPAAAPADELTTFIAIAALILSIAGIVAQLVSRYLDGGRIIIKLRHAAIDPLGVVYTNDRGVWPFSLEAAVTPTGRGHVSRDSLVDVAEIVIENKGRTPVTIYDVGLALPGSRRPRHIVRSRRRVTPASIIWEGYLDATQTVRVEPNDRVRFFVDYWTLFTPGRRSRFGRDVVRATAQVAGRRLPTRSSRLRAWKVPNTYVSGLAPFDSISIDALATRAVFLAAQRPESGIVLKDPLARLLTLFLRSKSKPTVTELWQRVSEAADKTQEMLWGLDRDKTAAARMAVVSLLVSLIRRYYENVVWPEASPGTSSPVEDVPSDDTPNDLTGSTGPSET